MAKGQTDIGYFSGRRGDLVGYCRLGTWCMRRYVAHINDSHTEAQLVQRSRFKTMMQFASRSREVIAIGLRREARLAGLVDNNLFLKLNKKWFSADGVDYSRLQFSSGPISCAHFSRAMVSDGVFSVRFCHSKGAVYVYAYCPDAGWGFLSKGAQGTNGLLKFALPDSFTGHNVHYYGFTSKGYGIVSATEYIMVGEEPEKDDGKDSEKQMPLETNRSHKPYVSPTLKITARAGDTKKP